VQGSGGSQPNESMSSRRNTGSTTAAVRRLDIDSFG
jgi:hypothetical protein